LLARMHCRKPPKAPPLVLRQQHPVHPLKLPKVTKTPPLQLRYVRESIAHTHVAIEKISQEWEEDGCGNVFAVEGRVDSGGEISSLTVRVVFRK
jgi:hypothetical protein